MVVKSIMKAVGVAFKIFKKINLHIIYIKLHTKFFICTIHSSRDLRIHTDRLHEYIKIFNIYKNILHIYLDNATFTITL